MVKVGDLVSTRENHTSSRRLREGQCTRLPPEVVNSEEELEVEVIIEHQLVGPHKQPEYLVQFKGYWPEAGIWDNTRTREKARNLHRDSRMQNPLYGKSTARTFCGPSETFQNWRPHLNPRSQAQDREFVGMDLFHWSLSLPWEIGKGLRM